MTLTTSVKGPFSLPEVSIYSINYQHDIGDGLVGLVALHNTGFKRLQMTRDLGYPSLSFDSR